MNIHTFLIPTRPQIDVMVALFLLRTFGKEKFSGVEHAQKVEVRATLNPGETFDNLIAQGYIPMDLGGGPFDHHGKEECVTMLTAKYLGVEKDPSLKQLLGWVVRDEEQGKGTLSRDPLDRAFGLAGLVSALNKAYAGEPQKVVDAFLPMIEGHWRAAWEHHVGHPQEVKEKEARGEYSEHTVRQGNKTFKLAFVVSDKPSMPTFLRSEQGGKMDVVLQKMPATNHYCVLTNQKRGVDLAKVAGLIRLREAELTEVALPDDESYITKTGRIDELPQWYYDPMTNSILNGGVYSRDVAESKIPVEEMIALVKAGLQG